MHAADWSGFAGRLETMRALLDVISVLCFNSGALYQLTLPVLHTNNHNEWSTEEEIHPADNTKNTSLGLLLQLAEAEDEDNQHTQQSIENIRKSALFAIQSACCINEKRKNSKKIMRAVQSHHGIQSLLRLIEIPGLRVFAAKALAGMCRIDEVKQILTKILRPGKLLRQVIDDHPDRIDFRNGLEQLLSKAGVPRFQEQIWDPDGARKADIVEQTRIRFNKKELYQLIDAYLREQGLTTSAEALRKEANIKPANVRKINDDFKTPCRKLSRDFDGIRRVRSGSGPNKIKFSRGFHSVSSPVVPKNINSQKKLQNGEVDTIPEKKNELTVSLGEIVQYWLREQHGKCRHPVLTVPEFSMYKTHRCPNPRGTTAPVCLTQRMRKRTQAPPWGGRRGKEFDKQLIWSRYKPASQNIRTSQESFATVCRLNSDEKLLVLGCSNGDILMYDSNT